MVSGLRQAFARIYNTIPMEVLEAAFNPHKEDVSLDECILKEVIRSRVRDDISLRGGKVFKLILDLNWCEFTTSPSRYALGLAGSYSTYKVPPEAREHRDICAVLGVRFPIVLGSPATSSTFYNNSSLKGTTVGSAACAALQAQTGAGQIVSPQGSIREGNVIQLNPPQYNFVPWQVKVRLMYDDNFSGMDVSVVYPFIELCEFAVKAYIYTKLIFQIESNLVVYGADIGVMKDIVSQYADANEKYDEQIIQLGGAELLDADRLPGILMRMVPRR